MAKKEKRREDRWKTRLSGLEQALLRLVYFLHHDLLGKTAFYDPLRPLCSIPYEWECRRLGRILELKILWVVALHHFGGHRTRVYFLANQRDGGHIRHHLFHPVYISFWLSNSEGAVPPPSGDPATETTVPDDLLRYLTGLGSEEESVLYGVSFNPAGKKMANLADEEKTVRALVKERFEQRPRP